MKLTKPTEVLGTCEHRSHPHTYDPQLHIGHKCINWKPVAPLSNRELPPDRCGGDGTYAPDAPPTPVQPYCHHGYIAVDCTFCSAPPSITAAPPTLSKKVLCPQCGNSKDNPREDSIERMLVCGDTFHSTPSKEEAEEPCAFCEMANRHMERCHPADSAKLTESELPHGITYFVHKTDGSIEPSTDPYRRDYISYQDCTVLLATIQEQAAEIARLKETK